MLHEHLQPTWDRLKADNHPSYQYVLAQGLRDNTAAPRYQSLGSWSALAYRMSGDRAFAQRSFDHVRNLWPDKTFTSAPMWFGDTLRESGTEITITLDWIRDGISAADFASWRDWLFRVADKYLTGIIRLDDSDQTIGALLFYAALDRAHGTSYLKNPLVVEMRDKTKWYCETLAEGGEWVESSDYNLNTLYLLLNGAAAAGAGAFPEIEALREPIARTFMQFYTPDLADTFEWGDDQTPHSPPWHLIEDLCALLGRGIPEVRGFETDVRAVWKKPIGPSFYSRYFTWTDPYASSKAWREWAGLYHVTKGQGHVYARTGWTPSDSAIMAMMPTFSKALLDHWYPIFGDFRVRQGARWLVDRPQGYTANLNLGNHTIVAGQGAPVEVGDLTGTNDFEALTYVSGTNAGVLAFNLQYYDLKTLLHERSVSIFWLKDRDVIVHLVRLHLDDVTALDRYCGTDAAKAAAKAEPPIVSLWQSQSAQPVITSDRTSHRFISGDSRIEPLYSCAMEVIDQSPLPLGSIYPSEKKWHVRVVPNVVAPFQVLTTVISNLADPVNATIEVLGDVQRVRVKGRAGTSDRDVVIYSSRRPGRKLSTSRTPPNKWGGTSIALDPSKIDDILPARNVTIEETWRERDADVYVEQSGELIKLAPSVVEPPPPARREWLGVEDADGVIILTRVKS